MNCPRCEEAVEQEARYCGNCGQQLGRQFEAPKVSSEPKPSAAQAERAVPGYARVNPVRQRAESRSRTALLLSILSLPAAIISLLGLVLAGCSLILATSVRSAVAKKMLNNAAIGVAALGIVLSVASAVFGYVYTGRQHDKEAKTASASNTDVQASDGSQKQTFGGVSGESSDKTMVKTIDTPCFRVALPRASLGVVESAEDNCNLQARSDKSFDASGRLFAVNAAKNSQVEVSNLAATAQLILSQNAGLLLSGYGITTERYTTFAGSPAYVVNAVKTTGRSTIQMAVVLRSVGHGENIFVVGYASDQGGADVLQFEQGWEWK